VGLRFDPAFWAPPIALAYRGWCRTLRYSVQGWERARPPQGQGAGIVFCLWHDELFPLPHLRRLTDRPLVTVVSQSRDGELLARVLERLGLSTARGSSSRGGLRALREAGRMMREQGADAVVTVDGPRGPRHQAKDGALYLAHRSGAMLAPVRLFMSRAKRFGSWDRFQLPWPGSRCRVVVGAPYAPFAEETKPDKDDFARARKELEQRLNGLEQKAGTE
jgi:hypothetical protein